MEDKSTFYLFNDLPSDIRKIQFLEYLPLKDLIHFTQSNREYTRIVQDPNFWRHLLERKFNIKYLGPYPRELYRFFIKDQSALDKDYNKIIGWEPYFTIINQIEDRDSFKGFDRDQGMLRARFSISKTEVSLTTLINIDDTEFDLFIIKTTSSLEDNTKLNIIFERYGSTTSPVLEYLIRMVQRIGLKYQKPILDFITHLVDEIEINLIDMDPSTTREGITRDNSDEHKRYDIFEDMFESTLEPEVYSIIRIFRTLN